jgi:hypothetical protein
MEQHEGQKQNGTTNLFVSRRGQIEHIAKGGLEYFHHSQLLAQACMVLETEYHWEWRSVERTVANGLNDRLKRTKMSHSKNSSWFTLTRKLIFDVRVRPW